MATSSMTAVQLKKASAKVISANMSFRGLMRPPICGAMRPAEVMVLVASDG
jgi:hypothetical protein